MTRPFHDIDKLPSEGLADIFATTVGGMVSLGSILNAKTDEEVSEILSDESLPSRNANAIRIKAFGSSLYEPKTLDEFRRYFLAALEYTTQLIKEKA